MLPSIAAFEFRYILRSPQSWFVFLVFFALGTLSIGYISGEGASDVFGLGRNVQYNSPFYLAVSLAVISLLAIFVAPHFVGEAIIKDREYHFEGIVFTTSISKFSYLYGRFLGGFGALLVTFLGAPLGMMLCPFWAFSFPEGSIASIDVMQYLIAMLVYALPSLLLFASMVFVVAVVARKIVYTHLLTLAVLVLLIVGMGLTGRVRQEIAQAMPFISPLLALLNNLPAYWTSEQLNTSLLSADPWGTALLVNRLLVTVLALALLGVAYLLFSFARHAAKPQRAHKQSADPGISTPGSAIPTRRAPSWSIGTVFRQFLLRTRFEFITVFWSLPFLLLMIINLGLMLDRLSYLTEVSFPETYVILNMLGGADLGILLIVAILIFSPEIIWREHKNKFHEIIHALPASNWVFVASKLLALICILIAVVVMNIALAVSFQMGDADIDLGLYLARLAFVLVPYICFAVLASFLQISANNRFVGMALTGIYLFATGALFVFGFQHPLYQNFLFADNLLPLSAMDADAGFQMKGYWLRVYWAGLTGVVLLLTYVFFGRGVVQPLKHRLQNLGRFRAAGFYLPAGISFLVAVGAGAFIYYNTNVLNRYFTQKDLEAQLAQYEVLYRQYENLPMPRITGIDMELAIFPDSRRLELQADIAVLNKTAQPINAVHLELPFEIEFESLTLPGATLSSSDATHRYAIYDLATPMAPGEQRILSMKGYKQLEGFRASREDITLVDNGTYFELDTLIPHIGLSRNRLLMDRETRQEYGLEPNLPIGTLDEAPATSRYFNNSPMRADSDLVNFAATVSTVAGQTAVTAGRLTEQWQQDGRSYFHYKTDAPILPVIPFFSARYAVLRDTWRDPAGAAGSDADAIDIEIYYHPQHAYHLELMMEALKEGLASFSAGYGPYQYQQLRVMEYPGYRRNSRSLPTTIAHSEANGFVLRDPAETYESMAHELSHHWWGHQIMSAMVEGAGMGEGLASYSARMLVEAKYGKEFSLHRNFVSANRRYLRGRNRDEFGERPLYKSVAQDYLDYSKGESVMYALQDIVGEGVVNTALREFVSTYKNSTRPYVVTTNFLEILKRTAEPEHLGLIEDLFEKITLYEFAVDAAKAEALDDGRYRVTLDITTAKFYGDVSGMETTAEFNSPVNIGLFTKHPLNRSFRIDEDVIQLELSSPEDGKSTVEFVVDKLPLFAGINPYDILIERDTTNNIRQVKIVD